jgi:hypothetical protein
MKTLTELQEEYRAEVEAFKKLETEHYERIAQIKTGVMEYARYAPGDKVWYLEKYWNENETKRSPGIIRNVSAEKNWRSDNGLVPVYRIGKATKSGAIHATANLGYSGIPEENIEPRSE